MKSQLEELGAVIISRPVIEILINEDGETLPKVYLTQSRRCEDAAALVLEEISTGKIPYIFMNGDSPYWAGHTIRYFSVESNKIKS